MRSRATTPEVSLFHLYSMRLAYLLLAVGLGLYIWPAVIHHTSEFAAAEGIRFGLLAGLGAMAILGLRYPPKGSIRRSKRILTPV